MFELIQAREGRINHVFWASIATSAFTSFAVEQGRIERETSYEFLRIVDTYTEYANDSIKNLSPCIFDQKYRNVK